MKIIVVITTLLMLHLNSCKSYDKQPSMSSLSSDSIASSQETLYLDKAFQENCQKMKNGNLSCQDPILNLACDTHMNSIDRAAFVLLSQSNLEYALQSEVIRAALAYFTDHHLRQKLMNCAQSPQNAALHQENDESASFPDWLIKTLSQDLAETRLNYDAPPFGVIWSGICNAAKNTLQQYLVFETDLPPQCLETKQTWLAWIASPERDAHFCPDAEIHALFAKQEESAQLFFQRFLTQGFIDTCFDEKSDAICDAIHTAFDKIITLLPQDHVEDTCKIFALAQEKKKAFPSPSIRRVTKKNSPLTTSWLIRDCCHCQIHFFSKESAERPPHEMEDKLLGTTHFLANLQTPHLLPQGCGGQSESVISAAPGENHHYDYFRLTDCSLRSVVGMTCPFIRGEKYRRFWNNQQNTPSDERILAPAFDRDRAPAFLQ